MTALGPRDFTHLHVHSEYSLLDGLGRITELVDTAVDHGFESLALTDHGALYGAVAFYQAATARGIKPIIGVETYVARRSMADREGKADAQPFHLILLAADMTGYRNLTRLVTDAHLDGYYYKPRIDREHLARHSAGLIGLSACLGGEIPRALETGKLDLRARAQAVQITHDASGRADAVVYLDADGKLHRQAAKVVCVAGNSIETPRLLLMSASALHPDGLANSSGQVGRNYMRHTTGSVYARFDSPVRMYRGETMAGPLADPTPARKQPTCAPTDATSNTT